MKKIGFTIGKFAPLHKGHQFLIEKGLSEMDEFYVIVYETDKIDIPVEKRAEWIKNTYPKAHVICAKNPPKKYGLDKDSVQIQMDYLLPIVKDIHATHFYSSELYGEKVAENMNIVDRRVDQERSKVPISATKIRTNEEMYRSYVAPSAIKDVDNLYNNLDSDDEIR